MWYYKYMWEVIAFPENNTSPQAQAWGDLWAHFESLEDVQAQANSQNTQNFLDNFFTRIDAIVPKAFNPWRMIQDLETFRWRFTNIVSNDIKKIPQAANQNRAPLKAASDNQEPDQIREAA